VIPIGATISSQLRNILQQHRSFLIDKLIAGNLSNYIDYKFNAKSTVNQLKEITNRLFELKDTRIDPTLYAPIFENVEHNDFTNLDNKIFYTEIDWIIQSKLFQPEFFKEPQQIFVSDHNHL
jgi:hypothetical protein